MDDMLNLFLTLLGVIILSVVVILVTRFQHGLFAFIISGVAGVLIVYWLIELKKTIRNTPVTVRRAREQKQWDYDIISANDEITFIAEVPGPDDDIKIELKDRKLKVIGSRSFSRVVELPVQVEIIESRCINGILNVKFRRLQTNRAQNDGLL